MGDDNDIPQMLKELLERGFSKQTNNYTLPQGMFNFVNSSSEIIDTFPNTRLLVLEGLPGAGKTTLKEMFRKDSSFEVVNQILPNNPDDDQHLTIKDIINSDEQKTRVFKNSSKQNILMDRYYVSTLAYNWAYDKVFHTRTYSEVEKWYTVSINNSKLIKPFVVFLIQIPLDYAFLRKSRIEEQNSKNPWLKKDFLRYFAQFYEYFFDQIETKTLLIKIDGTKPIEKIAKVIKQYEKYKD